MEADRDTNHALKQALARRRKNDLPVDFTFHAMQQVRKAAYARRKRAEVGGIVSLALGSVFLVWLLWYVLAVYLEFNLVAHLSRFRILGQSGLWGFYVYIALLALLLLGLDHWLRKRRRESV